MSESAVAEPSVEPSQPLPTADPELGDPLAPFDTPTPPAKEAKPETSQIEKPQQVKIGAKPEAAKPGEKEQKPADKPADDKGEKKSDEVAPVAPKALREAYDKLKREHREAETRYKSEIETLKKAPPADTGEWQKKYQELEGKHKEVETRFKTLDDEMRYIDYERSGEFREKYHQPYVEIVQRAEASLTDYKVMGADGTTERAATPEDLWAVVQATSQPEARKIAKQIFGDDDAQDILDWRLKIREANHSMQKAKFDFRKNGVERYQQMAKQQEEAATQAAATFKKLNDDAVAKYPQWFKAEEDDEEGAGLLTKGFEMADKAFSANGNMTPEQKIALHSAVRNQAAGFRFVAKKLERALAAKAELEKELEAFKESAPSKGAVEKEDKPADELADPFAKFDGK